MVEQTVITVSQLNRYIKSIVEENSVLANIFVVGEISNFKNHYSSGHLYLTLKDENAAVSAVIYRSVAQRIKYDLFDGLNVLVRGHISLYEKSGQYQIVVDDVQPQGIGELALAFEQLKQKLSEKGYFAKSHKKAIPVYPQRIGVITSGSGAAVRDITNIISRRFPIAQIILYPVEVQGQNASKSISKAITDFNRFKAADVLIVGRGGGSIEDLWAFNEENVADAIFGSEIPVISAVGHETDFTISDFVADVRAETPSAAAEICVPDMETELQNISSLMLSAGKYVDYKIKNEKRRISLINSSKAFSSPEEMINTFRIRIDFLDEKRNRLLENAVNARKMNFIALLKKLDALNPVKVIQRGFSVAKHNGTVIKSIEEVGKGDIINLTLTDGVIDCEVI